MKYVFIRADASSSMGSGHVMRCLTLAGELARDGMKVFFITRDLPGNMAAHIRSKGYPVLLLPVPPGDLSQNEFQVLAEAWQWDADESRLRIQELQPDPGDILLVVDHYSLDEKWERALRPVVHEIMVIDDLANRPHDCDRLLDQNYYRDMQRRYQGLVPAHCELLSGPQYALLRPEFYAAKQLLRQRDGIIRRVLVFFGGSDPTGETLKALQAIQMLNRPEIIWDVVVGASNPRRDEIVQICSEMRSVQFHCQIDNMAELMAEADLAIGAGGSATWERCFLGLPALVITVAENQVETTRDLAATGAIEYLGRSETVDVIRLTQGMREVLNDRQKLVEMGQKCSRLFA